MNVTLWEIYVSEEEAIAGGVAEIQYHLVPTNYWTGVPTNKVDNLIKSEDGKCVGLPMLVKNKEVTFRFENEELAMVEGLPIHDIWVVQTQTDIFRNPAQDILVDTEAVWDSSGLTNKYVAKPYSARSVESWLELFDARSRNVPRGWVAPSEVVGAHPDGVLNAEQAIRRLARGHEDCAAVTVYVAKKSKVNTP